jgi:hypothetical protein
MLSEFADLEHRDAKSMQRVTQVIAHLLRHQFVHSDDRGSPSLLETLRRPSLVRLIEAYFDVAGYRLIVRDTEGWAGILPDVERISPPRMRVDETLVLLLMRRLWEERIQNGEILNNGTVLLTLNEAFDAYQEVVASSRKSNLSPNDFRDVVRGLERRAIVELGEYDNEAQDMELRIRALVATVAGDDFVASLEQWLARPDVIEAEQDPEPASEPDPESEIADETAVDTVEMPR